MQKHFTQLAARITVLFICSVPAPSVACEWHQGMFLQNSSGEFHLPAKGTYADDVSKNYGEPLRRLSSGNGLSVWDYGSYRVMFNNNRVTFANMW